MVKRCLRRPLAFAAAVVLFAFLPALAFGDTDGGTQLVPDTAVLLAQSTSGGGGNGGNTSSTTSNTNIFSPGTFVDYKRSGGEPTTVVDRYPFAAGQPGCPATAGSAGCAPRDIIYVSNPLGVGYPGYSEFYKSSDGGQSFRVPPHDPIFAMPDGTTGGGGGDSHQAVGDVTHKVFFVDLSGACVTMNVSPDLGETFTTDRLGCGLNEGAIDDRQWVDVDETAPRSHGGNVYVNVNNDTGLVAPTIALVRSTHDGAPGTFVTDSVCNLLTDPAGAVIDPTAVTTGANDSTPTACPDPADSNLWISGPVVADKSPSSRHQHALYIPFERTSDNGHFLIYVAISTDEGTTWTRHFVADVGEHDPANIFPQLTIDTAGNLYYTWAQTQSPDEAANAGGETDVYYTYSTDGGVAWAPPVDLTPETNDSAVFPWMVAGDPGQVDLVYYKANTGLNPNIAFADSNGNACDEGSPGCSPNTTAWNTYFAQSQNALNTGANFKSVQISDHPIHIGGVCTGGIGCNNSQQANRDLLDFLTVDIDHLGAANVTWAEDNDGRSDTRQRFSRQLSGASVFKNQSISAQNTWPITDHAVTDPAGDVFDQTGAAITCPSMDILGTSEKQNADNTVTVSLTLGAPPTAAAAAACGHAGATGGLWGAEWWSAAAPDPTTGGVTNDYFYIAYRDNTVDGGPGVEAGRMNSLSLTLTSEEFHRIEPGTLGGTCFATPAPLGACTITLTASLTGLGIKAGAGLYSITGLSTYFFGTENRPPFLRVPLGDSQQADAATPFDDNGTGTTTK